MMIEIKGKQFSPLDKVAITYSHYYGGAEYGQLPPEQVNIEVVGVLIDKSMGSVIGQFSINPKSLRNLPQAYWPGNAEGYKSPYEGGTEQLQDGRMRIPIQDIITIDSLISGRFFSPSSIASG